MKRTVLIIIAVLAFLIALPLIVGGSVLAAIGAGDDPTIRVKVGEVKSPGHAVVSDAVQVQWNAPFSDRYNIQVGAQSVDGSKPLFLGYGPAHAVDSYLSGVPYTLVFGSGRGRSDANVDVPGTATPQPPGGQDFWVAETTGVGLQQLSLPSDAGNYRFVVMNADASRDVALALYGSITLPFLMPIGVGMLVFGGLILVLGVVLLILGIQAQPAVAVPVDSPGTWFAEDVQAYPTLSLIASDRLHQDRAGYPTAAAQPARPFGAPQPPAAAPPGGPRQGGNPGIPGEPGA